MTQRPAMLLLASTLALCACTTMGGTRAALVAGGTLYTAAGPPAGTVQLIADGDTLTLTLAVAGLASGAHGLHLHTVGACDPPGFASAGAHLNPGAHQHGTENPAGSHLGDLPNLIVNGAGTGTLTAQLRGSRAMIEPLVFDSDGTAVVIHAGPDDYRTDPSGNSGSRIACAVLRRG